MKRRVTTDIHIYKITNRINGKVYIGQTYRNVHTRFMEHMIDPESGVYADVCKYGRAVFTYDLLHTCLPQYAAIHLGVMVKDISFMVTHGQH